MYCFNIPYSIVLLGTDQDFCNTTCSDYAVMTFFVKVQPAVHIQFESGFI